MIRIQLLIISVLIILAIFLNCSIKAPEVRVTGEKTALEREVLGTYHRMTEDTWMIASTRSEKSEKQEMSEEKKQVLDALQQQKFNKDDIDEFKRLGFIGENNQGFLEIRNQTTLQDDTNTFKLVHEIVKEENNDREVIMNRVVELNQNLKNAVKENIMTIFAQMYQENSPIGTWIQQKVGEWGQK